MSCRGELICDARKGGRQSEYVNEDRLTNRASEGSRVGRGLGVCRGRGNEVLNR